MHTKLVGAMSLALLFAACDASNGEEGTDKTCLIPGAVFVENGPNGAGCYCTGGTVPNGAGTACVTPDGPDTTDTSDGSDTTPADTTPADTTPADTDTTVVDCGPWSRENESGQCVDIDECAEGTSGCSDKAECINVTNDATRCRCLGDFVGDGFTCTCPEGQTCLGVCVDTPEGVDCTETGLMSSLADPASSPYPNMQCAGSVGPEALWFRTNQKTTFPVDCRCPPGSSEPGHLLCAAPTAAELAGEHFGAGPNAADAPSGELKGCATDHDADVVYFGVNWSDTGDNRRGFVFAMDPVTANRTLISGEYQDPANGNYEVGAGESFDTILDMHLGQDGYLYVFEDSVPGTTAVDTSKLFGRSVYRVDLVTGDRELWWNDREAEFAAAHCPGRPGDPSGRPDLFNHQFEMDEEDNMFFTVRGNGIIRVAHDRSKCDWITSNGAEGPGTGFDLPAFDSGWGYRDGIIYGTDFITGGIYKVEVATGKRSRVFGGPLGSGPGPGVWHFFYLPYLDLWVAGGNEAQTPSNAALFDPATGQTWGWMYQKPDAETGSGSGGNDTYAGPAGTNRLRGPILGTDYMTLIDRPWCLSPIADDRLFVATDRVGITIVELQTGNTMNFSQ